MAIKLISLDNLKYFYSKITELLDGKVGKKEGYDLSKNDFTDSLKTKLEGIEVGAEVNTITGVKGSAEDEYRVGDVEITAANIGLDNVENKSSATIRSEITSENVTSALGFTPAQLDENGLVPASQLPSYVDDVVEVADKNALPAEGESGKIYVTIDDNLTYRWSGTQYIEISKSLAIGETASTAFAGDKGKAAYDHALITEGNPHNVTAADLGLDKVENKTAAEIIAEIDFAALESVLVCATENEIDAMMAEVDEA